jgi:hypothetical protein
MTGFFDCTGHLFCLDGWCLYLFFGTISSRQPSFDLDLDGVWFYRSRSYPLFFIWFSRPVQFLGSIELPTVSFWKRVRGMWQTQSVVCTVLCLCACVFLQHCWGGGMT